MTCKSLPNLGEFYTLQQWTNVTVISESSIREELENPDFIMRREWEAREMSSVHPVLFLHGIESHSLWFDSTATQLNRLGMSAYSYDRPGWGKSKGPRGDCGSLEKLKEMTYSEIRRIQDRTGRQVHLVGQSWGGLIALTIARECPELFYRLTLIAPGVFPLKAGGVSTGIRAMLPSLLRAQAELALPLVPEDFSSDQSVVSYVREDRWRVSAISPSTYRASFAMIANIRRMKSNQLSLPPDSLCILAENDKIIDTQRTVHLMGELGIKVCMISGAGHSISLEQPEKVAKLIGRIQ